MNSFARRAFVCLAALSVLTHSLPADDATSLARKPEVAVQSRTALTFVIPSRAAARDPSLLH